MKNIWEIFRRDIKRIKNNVIAMIVIMGITVVPCLYAWFNIAASWDPYKNTGNLKVAVASVDKGYEGSLIPLELNMGDQVLTSLRSNSQLDWVFTSKKKAVSGVKSGKYYAAIVIPENFSTDMMSLFSENISKPSITYYSNAKENAIAPKVTDKGASAIQRQVNEVFIETISDTVITSFKAVTNVADQNGVESIAGNLANNLDQIGSDLNVASATLSSFAGMTTSAQQLLDTTGTFLKETQNRSDKTTDALKTTKKSFNGIEGTINGATDGVNEALNSGKEFYSQMSGIIDSAFASNSQSAADVAATLNTLASSVEKVTAAYQSLQNSIDDMADKVSGIGNTKLNALLGNISGKLGETIATQTELKNQLQSTASSLTDASGTAIQNKAELDKLVKESADSLANVKSDYEKNVKNSLDKLSKSMGDTSSSLGSLMDQLDASVDGVYDLSSSASADLTQINKALDHSCKLLDKASGKISETTGKISQMQSGGDFSQLEELISGDSSVIGEFLAAPVSLKTNQVYKIENYGSSMAPFYSTLSIWIGGIVLVAMLKTGVSTKCTEGLKKVKPHQEYLGRYLIFLIVGLLQSTLICLGDLLYLGIQCKHPFLFMLAGWFSSIVYVNIIYTLTVSFGDIGKAVSVVLLVMQVAGSGGTFPIEVAPAFFKAVYPLLPFVHSMAAFRETIGGMYGMTYWTELGKLGIFLLLSLILGLLLRKPVIRMNEVFAEKLEETKIM